MVAFQNFRKINNEKDIIKKHREWLKQYIGLIFSKAVDGKHLMKWRKESNKYDDSKFDTSINCIQRLKNRCRIEFDDKKPNGEKNLKKIQENIEETKAKLEEKGFGYIESTHFGNSNYLWVEFTRNMKDSELKQFLNWISPEDSEVDLNFASSRRVFPVLYAIHWKHSNNRERPINFYEGEQIDYDKLGISPINRLKQSVKQNYYQTYNVKAGKVFSKQGQAEYFNELQPFFYDKNKIWWMWNKTEYKWEIVDEVDILNMVNQATGMDVISSKERTEILNALKQEGRKCHPEQIKPTWIQFKNKIVDIKTGEEFEASPKYFVTNPIPYKRHNNNYEKTPTMDKLFEEWVGKKYVKTLYEILAYSLIPSYPIHRLFCLLGSGSNGKSCFLRLMKKFVGKENVTATELDTLLNSRFEKARLHKKLVCLMGETNFQIIENTSIIKKLTGQDTIGFEYKNKNPFEDENYAKIIIATNNLPVTTDKTVGFYRRWLIIDFPTQFPENEDILKKIPEEEYEALARKCSILLKDLLEKQKFHNEGSINERMKRYEEKSNPFEKFINEFCSLDNPDEFITKSEFSRRLNEWLIEKRFRKMGDRTINKMMSEKDIISDRDRIDWWENGSNTQKQVRVWRGIKWNEVKND